MNTTQYVATRPVAGRAATYSYVEQRFARLLALRCGRVMADDTDLVLARQMLARQRQVLLARRGR